jgi:hypothetical protein
MSEHSESAGEEARPAAEVKVEEKAAKLQHQRAALPSQKYCCTHTEGLAAGYWFVLVARQEEWGAWIGLLRLRIGGARRRRRRRTWLASLVASGDLGLTSPAQDAIGKPSVGKGNGAASAPHRPTHSWFLGPTPTKTIDDQSQPSLPDT